jgi:hypothetical protein
MVMRHASSPREAPTKEQANPDNLKQERQLDESGRRGAPAMGEALRGLQIPMGAVRHPGDHADNASWLVLLVVPAGSRAAASTATQSRKTPTLMRSQTPIHGVA